MNSIVHIAPQLPPAIDGVGDYCWNLWRHWPEPLPAWKFLVIRGEKETARVWPEVRTREFQPAKESLCEALAWSECDTAVLHYVGYGFQPKGIPTWLPGAIAQWKRNGPKRRLVTMFHEMYARSSPLRSPFWVAPLARKIIRQLVSMSDSWVTSCERYFKQLTGEFAAQQALGRILPIGSNILPIGHRPVSRNCADAEDGFRFVVFGLPRTRLWALERHWRLLRALHETGALKSITLLGRPHDSGDDRVWEKLRRLVGAEGKWNLRFDLSVDDISRELLVHDFGLLANEPDTLTKSGVFAAFATHGVVPIVSQRTPGALPVRLEGAVIGNDESGNVCEFERMLRQASQLQERRKTLLDFAAQELSWRRISENWSLLLQPAGVVPQQADFIAARNTDPPPRMPSLRRPFVTQP